MSNLQAIAVYINKNESIEDIKTKIIESLNFDADWSGDNGDYLDEEAEKLGYEFNNEWFVNVYFKTLLKEDIEEFYQDYFKANDYYSYDLTILEIDNNTFISLAVGYHI